MKCNICGHIPSKRSRTGPAGSRKKDFSILVDECTVCGGLYPLYKCLTYEETVWIEKWNNRMKRVYNGDIL